MKLKDLIGYQLVNINEDKIVVEKDDKQFEIEICIDAGDCCGYNDVETNLLINENNKPVITNITDDEDCDFSEIEDGWCSTARITFYGANKKLATLDSMSSSGSGWSYGACVTVRCKELNLEETITAW